MPYEFEPVEKVEFLEGVEMAQVVTADATRIIAALCTGDSELVADLARRVFGDNASSYHRCVRGCRILLSLGKVEVTFLHGRVHKVATKDGRSAWRQLDGSMNLALQVAATEHRSAAALKERLRSLYGD